MHDAEDIIRRHGPVVWRTVWRLVGRPGHDADVADCFQDVFVAALHAGRRGPVRNWEALLRRIATAKALDVLRARLRRRDRTLESDDAWDTLGAPVDPPHAALERAEVAAELRDALSHLSPHEAELFCLRHLEDMSLEEIADATGMTPGAAGVALHRTKAKLRDRMARRVDNGTSTREV
jgi:RNA polymerase sigma-70 factor (ECF subfamily)